VVGIGLAGLTGLLVRGQAQTTLRGDQLGIGTIHFWLGIALAVLVVLAAAARLAARGRRRALGTGTVLAALGVLVVVAAVAQGYLGGRMTYRRAVGISRGGELAQSARGAAELEVAVAHGTSKVRAGQEAFSAGGLACASCHGDRAQGERGPPLAGGRGLDDFRRVHADGLFPARIVPDRDFGVIDAYLRSLGRPDARH
jgi:mono/diheme cytochrome c family protein